MHYSPKNKYLWDFWMISSEKHYHLFYLQADRNLPSPDDRHEVASIGHAISPDLYQWREMGTVLEKGPDGEWDDTSLWTGSIIKKNDLFYMFYTSRFSREKRKVQRIGLAISEDLHHWEKYKGNPIITANPQWYETSQISEDGLEHWRDPYVIYHPKKEFIMLLSVPKRMMEKPKQEVVSLGLNQKIFYDGKSSARQPNPAILCKWRSLMFIFMIMIVI